VSLPALLNNRYRPIAHLGSGGFGETFLAEDTHLPSGRRCVVKKLRAWTDRADVDEQIKQRFQREAALLEALSQGSEQIPQLYAYFGEGTELYLIQEWIVGLTLEAWVKQQGKASEADVLQLLQQLSPVLNYVHQQGIIHRDIKPSNIILREEGQLPVLIDFGIAKESLATQPLQSDFTPGTAGFMAPEQAAGQPFPGSDIYSLGLTAIYLLTGKLPQYFQRIDGVGPLDWTHKATVSSEFAGLLNRMTAMNGSDRPRSISALQTLLARFGFDQTRPITLYASDSAATPTAERSPETIEQTLPPPSTFHQSEITQAATQAVARETAALKLATAAIRDRQVLINKVRNYWIKGVLETSLHDRALIALGFEQRLDALSHPWSLAWETTAQPRKTLPNSTRVVDLFDQLGQGGTLLILGEPGSGKTTTLLELCRDLLARLGDDPLRAIPVVLNLSTWRPNRNSAARRYQANRSQGEPVGEADKTDIASWVRYELNAQYQVSKDLAQTWLRQQQLLLLLDGLDEVAPEQRDNCVQALNQFVRDHGSTGLVVCSRIQDYEALTERLQLQAAVFIRPLSQSKIRHYLDGAGQDLAAVHQALQTDPVLQELAQSPLMLNIITLAYQGMTPEELPELSLEARREHVFDNYIQRMLARRGSRAAMGRSFESKQAITWLKWLAKQLNQRSQTILLLEQLQPNWLPSLQQEWLYRCGLLISFVLILTIPGYAVMEADRLFLSMLIAICVFGPIFGRMEIKTVETLTWSWAKARRNIVPGALVGAIAGCAFKVPYELILNPYHLEILDFSEGYFPWRSIYRGTVFGLSTGLLFGFIRSWTGPGIRRKATLPNQGIRQSAKHSLFFGFFGWLSLSIAAFILDRSIVSTWGVFGLLFGACLGGGEACIKHLLLRIMLWRNGAIAWNYAAFLDWGVERIFLQKVGGGYIFVHRLLLEHFARRL